MSPPQLTEDLLLEGLCFLTRRDPQIREVFDQFGPPPLWAREPGFPTLIKIILEQQVSLASAQAAFDRLLAWVSPLLPAGLLSLDDAQMKAIGFSRQKTGYARYLAESILDGDLDLGALSTLDDASVRSELTRMKGIGPWSADIYLLMALRRPDVWPNGDLALATAAQEVKKLPTRPGPKDLQEMAKAWRPWRAVAARVLWHAYLSRRR